MVMVCIVPFHVIDERCRPAIQSPGVVPRCLRPDWAAGGVLARFSNLLEEYKLSWGHMVCEEAEWKQRVSNAIQKAFEQECKDAAAKDQHNHPLLEFPHANRCPRLKHVLSFGGGSRTRCPTDEVPTPSPAAFF